MKKLFNLVILVLAINFLAVAGGVGWLFQSGHLDRARVSAVKQALFPPPAPPEAPATQPSAPDDAPPPPSRRLAELLARYSGRPAAEQVQFVQQTFDTTMAQLDRRERDLSYREEQVARANARLADDRKLLDADRQKLDDQSRQAEKLAADKGFQDTLNLYNTMSGKQVKRVFMGMDESAAAEYLDAMEPRAASKILKEFKTPEESDRMKRILEKMRHPPGAPSADVAAAPSGKE